MEALYGQVPRCLIGSHENPCPKERSRAAIAAVLALPEHPDVNMTDEATCSLLR